MMWLEPGISMPGIPTLHWAIWVASTAHRGMSGYFYLLAYFDRPALSSSCFSQNNFFKLYNVPDEIYLDFGYVFVWKKAGAWLKRFNH